MKRKNYSISSRLKWLKLNRVFLWTHKVNGGINKVFCLKIVKREIPTLCFHSYNILYCILAHNIHRLLVNIRKILTRLCASVSRLYVLAYTYCSSNFTLRKIIFPTHKQNLQYIVPPINHIAYEPVLPFPTNSYQTTCWRTLLRWTVILDPTLVL